MPSIPCGCVRPTEKMHDVGNIQERYRRLKTCLAQLGRVGVAFSGGVDSTLLLRAAADVLGRENVLALTAVSETTPEEEQRAAARSAGEIGVFRMVIPTDELRLKRFVDNPVDRCYHCRRLRFEQLVRMACDAGFSLVVDGENADDINDYRPGRRAARELGIKSPLCDAGFSKIEIRTLARQLGLQVWDRPSSACLASRIPSGMKITAERLRLIDRGEMFLREAGIVGHIRARLMGDRSVSIELSSEGLERIVREPLRTHVVAFFKDLGFSSITVDLQGYRTGSLNPTAESMARPV